jgi:hypothetical protein
MKILLCLLAFSAFATTSFAQKIKIEGDLITIDGQPYARIEQDGCGLMDENCSYYVKSLQNQRLFIIKQLEMNDPEQINVANPKGRTLYLQYVFTAAKATAETPFPATLHLRPLDIARKLYKAQLLKDGTLDEQAAADFVVNYGTVYSERRRALNQPVIIVAPSH